ncbi:AraC family transcriptional regulator [Streptomyces sp. NPDC048717]|uniref:AraC family transcriptional regulator n=1 Tax=Streptomyces sp. NPDC048717 TaxID=3154928 RepID=UPI003416FCF1
MLDEISTRARMVPAGAPDPALLTARPVGLGALRLRVIRAAGDTYEYRPGPADSRPTSGRHALVLMLMLEGKAALTQEDRTAIVCADDLVLLDPSRPLGVRPAAEPSRAVVVEMPQGSLPLSAADAERLFVVPLSGARGPGALLAPLLSRVAADPDAYGGCDGARVAGVVAELAGLLFDHWLRHGPGDGADVGASQGPVPVPVDGQGRGPVRTRFEPCPKSPKGIGEVGEAGEVRLGAGGRRATRQSMLLSRVQAYVQEHLAAPDLTPDTIAAAHHISTRYLHRIFQQQGLTVAAWVRRQRLDRCRLDLADPSLGDLPVRRVAARWGFDEPASFTRAFRAAYGTTPGAFRVRAGSTECAYGVNDAYPPHAADSATTSTGPIKACALLDPLAASQHSHQGVR